MSTQPHTLRYFITVMTLAFAALAANAFNMRQFSNKDGLSNSAILSLCSDDNGYLWIGTCDGVNISDGTSINPFSSVFPNLALSGNIIEGILNGGHGQMWVLSNHGLDLVNTTTGNTISYPGLTGQELMYADNEGNLFVLREDSSILYRRNGDKSDFSETGKIRIPFSEVFEIMMVGDNLLAITSKGIFKSKISESADGNKRIADDMSPVYNRPIQFAEVQEGKIFIIDESGYLCEIKPGGASTRIADLSDEIRKRGKMSGIVNVRQGNFFISFVTDGAIWVGMNEEKQFQAVDLGLNVGVFCLEPSTGQDVVWIGTDCQGIYTYWDDPYSIRSFDFSAFNHRISHPVRAINLDKFNNLWVGTKGGGLLKIPDFNEYYPKTALGNGVLFNSANSALNHNSVFAFCESKSRPVMWIGSEEGLNYFNYDDGLIHKAGPDQNLRYVHGLVETDNSTLWACTLGQGVVRIDLEGDNGNPKIKSIKKYTLDGGAFSTNQFFSIAEGKDGTLYFCNRGRGLFVIKNDRLTPVPIKYDFGTNAVKDVFDAVISDGTFWLGTGNGLVKASGNESQHFFGPDHGFPNNTIHDIITDTKNNLWFSTNNGIIRFDTNNNESTTYGKNYGLNVTEFSDGASLHTGTGMIFGGINGIVTVNRNDNYVEPKDNYAPQLSLFKLTVDGENASIFDHSDSSGPDNELIFEPGQNHFSLTFAAPDFINGGNYTFYYTLDGKEWINNGADPTISFNQMNHGSYNLKVKYINRATGLESKPLDVNLVIKAPWYLSLPAKIIYAVIFINLVLAAIWLYLRRQKEKQDKKMLQLQQQHKEEVYEEKLRFFTNITHEFCTPLTLIYGPCERILSYPGSDDYIMKYVELIRKNTERLNNLIQELIEFRRIETGHKVLKIRPVNASSLCKDTFDSFTELAERNNINYHNEIKEGIVWNSDFSCMKKILNNLISNAFKYTAPGGAIKVGAEVRDGRLCLWVHNTGKGIKEEDKKRIFNRYTVLDNVEQDAIKGISSRNGLGMSICHSMVDLLLGTITIESEVGKYAEFIVVLPGLTPSDPSDAGIITDTLQPEPAQRHNDDAGKSELPSTTEKNPDKKETTILVVDDNREILSLLKDCLSRYNVVTAENAEQGLNFIKETPPSLIISDIMMPGTDGAEFTRQIKGNRHTMHIPLVLLSAKTSNDEKIAGLESGADAYIGKPFSVSYLKAVVRRLLESRTHLKEYYSSSASTFEFNGGKLMHKEERDFLTKVTEFIDSHIDDNELSAEQIALHLKTSSRNLYRKFKEIGEVSPNDFIKTQRINYAARLLLTTTLTVQEIIYRSGFTNRCHFYKEFSKRFNCTPKEYRTENRKKDENL